MEDKKRYQDWCVDTLLAILKSRATYRGDDHDQGYIYVIKAIINHYASMFYCDRQMHLMRSESKEHLNLWWDHLNDGNRNEFFDTLLMSSEARRKVKGRTPMKELKHHLHLEHITPVGWIYSRLCALSAKKGEALTRDDVLAELKYDRLVLLTKKQSKRFLDGAKRCFTDEDCSLLRNLFPQFSKDHDVELTNLNGSRSKDSGFGLLRMAKLVNFHVNFVYADGRPCPPEKWMEYFNNPTMVITKDLK